MSATAAVESLIRQHERSQGRQLVDIRLGGWDDLASEVLLLALAHWLPSRVRPWAPAAGVRYVSLLDGDPDRVIHVQVVRAPSSGALLRQAHLLAAAALGDRYWLYLVVLGPGASASLVTLQDPARAEWRPPARPAAGVTTDVDVWHLPASVVDRIGVSAAAA